MDRHLRKSVVLIVLIAILVQGHYAVCFPQDQDLDSIKEAAKAIRTIKADFRQIRQLKILEVPLISRGMLYYKAPDLLRWEYFSPLKSVMLKQGDIINLFQFQDGVWKSDPSQAVEVRGIVFAEINRWLKGRFDKSVGFTTSYSSGPPVRLTLTPNDEFSRFLNRIELVFSERPGIIRFVEIIESEEAKIRIEFTNLDINSDIPAEIFKKP